VSISRSLRLLAVGGLLPLLAACTSVGLGAQTGQVYIPADGANNRTGTVYVLNAVVVSGRVGAGTLVTTFVDTDTQSPDTVSSITGTGLTVTGTLPTVPAGGHVNLATIPPIFVTGTGVKAGGYVTLTFEFQNGSPVTMDIPVVDTTGPWASITLPPATL
jgi:hypothetical protein